MNEKKKGGEREKVLEQISERKRKLRKRARLLRKQADYNFST